MRIAFVMPVVTIGGGSYVVLQHAHYLAEQGHEVHLVLETALDHTTRAWHRSLTTLPVLAPEEATRLSFDVGIVGFWTSIATAMKLEVTHLVYFAQGIERRIYSRDETGARSAVERVYSMGLAFIAIGTDTKEYLEGEHGARVWLAPNGIDRSVFRPDGPSAEAPLADGLRVLVEGPLGVEFKNVPRSVRLAREGGAKEVWLLTNSQVDSYPGADRVFSQVPVDRIADVYRACDVLVKLSLVEGFGLPPLEMFCCGGTAVLYETGGYKDYVRPGVNAIVCAPNDEACVVESLRSLGRDPALLERLRSHALDTAASWPDWDAASTRFAECLEEIAAGPPRAHADLISSAEDLSVLGSAHIEARRPSMSKRLLAVLPSRMARVLVAVRVRWLAWVGSRRQLSDFGD